MAQQHYRTPFKKALLQFITEPDPFLSMLKWVMTEMMRIEAEAKVGATKGKHTHARTTYFSGARARRIDTRMGTVYLLVPKVRKGGYVPFFISERRRSEQALIAVVQEAFINGVSTRKIERLAHAMGIENISAGQVSEFNKELDAQAADFKTRPLDEEYQSRVRARTKVEAERVGKYMVRPILALDRLSFLERAGKVGYRHGQNGAELETMDYLEFIARVTSHIPDKGQVMVRYYGLYANAHKHLRAGRIDGGRFGLYSWRPVSGAMSAAEESGDYE